MILVATLLTSLVSLALFWFPEATAAQHALHQPFGRGAHVLDRFPTTGAHTATLIDYRVNHGNQYLSESNHPNPSINKATSLQCRRNKVNADLTNNERAALEKSPPSNIYREIKLRSSDIYRLAPENSRAARKGPTKKIQVGNVRSISLNPLTQSRCFDLGNAGHAALMAVVSSGARQVRIHFTKTALPDGARLFVYSLNNVSEIYGPYELRGPSGSGDFWSPPVEGDGVVIEYYSPRPATRFNKKTPFRVTEISHVF